MQVDLYYTMRSPYCYLATPGLADLVKSYDLTINLKPVYPLAVSDSSFFERVNPLWPAYVQRDTARIAGRLGIPFHWPRPDPIVQDPQTRAFAEDQPLIRRLTHLAQLAAEQSAGLEYIVQVSGLLFHPNTKGWDQGQRLSDAMAKAGLDLSALEKRREQETDRLEARIKQNRAEQLAAGHWGAPLFVHETEIFFGQDRMDDLVWHLTNHGLTRRDS